MRERLEEAGRGTFPAMARWLLLAASLAFLAAGCGGGATGGSRGAGDALAYLPADAATVVLVSTDVDGEQWEQFDKRIVQRLEPQNLDEYASQAAKGAGLDWEDDVKPLLGNDIALGVMGDPASLLGGDGDFGFVAALDTSGGDIEDVLQKAKFRELGEAGGAKLFGLEDDEEAVFAVEDGVFIYAQDEKNLRAALSRRDSGEGLDESTVDEALTDLPTETFARAFGTLEGIAEQEELRRFAELPLVQALETWGLTAAFEGSKLNLDVAVRLDGERIGEEDLPLVTGSDAPEIVIRGREISGGNRNQSQTTAFLLRALRAGYPNSRFVRAADAIEKELGIDFEQEILRQFDGPSASYVSPNGKVFAARSEVRDPAALEAVLPKLAPHLPALVEGLQGLQSEGMALLFLFAPDAPAAAPMRGVQVDPPATEDGFYRISGLTGDGPAELYLGLVGDVFVVASDEQRAREIATADTKAAAGAQGAGVLRANVDQTGTVLGNILPITGKELVASLEASTDELRARVRYELD